MNNWTVNIHAVTESEAGRVEKSLSEMGETEFKKAMLVQNDKALRAAGYSPVLKETRRKIAR